jgi:restriction system protein
MADKPRIQNEEAQMSIPSEKYIEIPLLQEMEVAGGQAKPSELYDKVANHFPRLTSDDQQAKHPRTGIPIWRNRVQWARQHLVNKGEVDASVRGIWRITEKGRARLGLASSPPPSGPQVSTILELLGVEKHQVRVRLHELMMNLHPQQFEAFAGTLLESLGFTDVEITSYVGDGGIDGYGNLEMGVVKVKAAFQCKRWRNNVSRRNVAQFRGDIQGRVEQGIFITTSDFSKEAKKVSSVAGAVPIVLINGDRIVDIMLEKGLGVRQEPLTVTRVDEEFFAAFGTSEE